MPWLEKRAGVYRVCYREGTRVRRLRAYTDKLASQDMLADLRRALARGERGLFDPYKEHRDCPIDHHVADWVKSLRDVGRDDEYVRPCESRVKRLAAECGWRRLGDISAE